MKRLLAPLLGISGVALALAGACAAPDPKDAGDGDGDSGEIDPTTGTDSSAGDSSGEITSGTLDPTTGSVDPTTTSGDEDPVQEDCDATLELTVRDFNSDHPDMESTFGGWDDIGCGMVQDTLFVGADGARTPLFQASNGTGKRSVMNGVISCKP